MPSRRLRRFARNGQKRPTGRGAAMWVVLAGITLVVLAVVIRAVVSGSLSMAEREGWQTYQSETLGFELALPPGWTVEETDAASGPDIVVTEEDGLAFVRIRGFLDLSLDNADAIERSIDDYEAYLSTQTDTALIDFERERVWQDIGSYQTTGVFLLQDIPYAFRERAQLSTWGEVLVMRAANDPTRFVDSLATMEAIMESFTLI